MTRTNPPSGPTPAILLVEDDDALRSALTRGLEARGFVVRAVGTAKEALRAAEDPELPIDVIVMDIVLPDSWGAQVAVEQSFYRPEAKVLFISGHAEGDDVLRAAVTAEGSHFLEKPFTVDDLVAAIETIAAEPEEG